MHAIFFVCSEKMLSIEYVIKREFFETRCRFLWKLFLGVRYNSLMILFENAEKYSNMPFWLIFNLTSLLILSLWELVGISFSFAWFLLCFFFLVSKHSDDSRVVRINIFWSWTCWSCFRFFCPDGKRILADVVSSASNIVAVQKFMDCNHLKIFWRLLRLLSCDLKKVDVVGLSWMDESFFWDKILLMTRYVDFREIVSL